MGARSSRSCFVRRPLLSSLSLASSLMPYLVYNKKL